SLLFDADRLSWIRWWDGGFLYRTKQGRLWEWHPEGRALWTAAEELPPVVLAGPEGEITLPEAHRERFGSFAELGFEGDAVVLRLGLNGPVGVTARIGPTEDGWERRVTIRGVPEGRVPLVVAATGATPVEDGDGSRWRAGGAIVEVPGDRAAID